MAKLLALVALCAVFLAVASPGPWVNFSMGHASFALSGGACCTARA